MSGTDDRGEIDEHSGVETTGHEWDGIRELNNPLPRWWLWVFYATIAWAFVYWIFMPSWPGITGHLRGLRDHSERVNVERAMSDLRASRRELGQKLLTAPSLDEIERDPTLFQFAMAAGASAFGDNCATCHGTGGQGFPGYPNLNDDVWLWGGTLDDINSTLRRGIRSHPDDTRMSLMPAFGEQGLLTPEQVNDMTTYVISLSDPEKIGSTHAEAVARAAPVYQAKCAVCHGTAGQGDRSQGAPNLVDAEWLYGRDRASIRAQIWAPRHGVMPAWGNRLDDQTIAALSVYVHALGGGEASNGSKNDATGESLE